MVSDVCSRSTCTLRYEDFAKEIVMSNFNLSNDFSHCSDEKYYIYGSGTIDDREKSVQYISSFPDRTFSIVEMVDGYFAKVLTCINNLNFGKLTYYY